MQDKSQDDIIKNTSLSQRTPKHSIQIDSIDSYYLNNREMFVKFVDGMFSEFKTSATTNTDISCDNIGKKNDNMDLMNHQKIVQKYMNLYSPYRGLLLYHGLGSGKTLSSVAIAEGLKSRHKIIVMSPASLHSNYAEEIKSFGDTLYRKHQYWEWITLNEISLSTNSIQLLTETLGLPDNYIKKKKGVWLFNATKSSNYADLGDTNRKSLNEQLEKMIDNKYQFIHYNGLRLQKFNKMSNNNTVNIFDNSVLIIDEAHNFVSRIVNKLNSLSTSLKKSKITQHGLSIMLYEQILSAQNCRIVFLSGTPIINFINEIGVMFNMLRGYIYTWELQLESTNSKKVDGAIIKNIFNNDRDGFGNKIVDYISYKPSTNTLSITRTPYFFENSRSPERIYNGVKNVWTNATIRVSNDDFINHIGRLLTNSNINIKNTKLIKNTALPDDKEDFSRYFLNIENNCEVDEIKIKNIEKFKRRIIGLTSYFRSAQEELMPRYSKEENFNVVNIFMSDYQFGIHEMARSEERKKERNSARGKTKNTKNDIIEQSSSTYRIFSRLACNFAVPDKLERPIPISKWKNDKKGDDDDENDDCVDDEQIDDVVYKDKLHQLLKSLAENPEYLTTDLGKYSEKLKIMYEKISDVQNPGLHLVYSQFRTLEGIGIFALVLEAHKFVRLNIKRDGTKWIFDPPLNKEDNGKRYVMYTGTENKEDREIVRNIYNGNWSDVPSDLTSELEKLNENNNMGEIAKIIMITASGSEGINLKNTRFVHIMESYWNPIRIEQIIGRARRICSHNNLPEEYQTVDVYLYLTQYTTNQISGNNDLKLGDSSAIIKDKYLTSDEKLYEVATIKEKISEGFLKGIKESSIDCSTHMQSSNKEDLTCISFGDASNNRFTYNPDYTQDESDETFTLNKTTNSINVVKVTINGKVYAYREDTKQIYDYDSFIRSTNSSEKPIIIGVLKDGKIVK